MLYIQEVAVDMIRELRGPIAGIEKADRDLGRQLRRAAASVALNIAEGTGNSGGTKRERYRSALGSLNEVEACLMVGEAFGYIQGSVEPARACLRLIGKGLRKLA